MSFSQPFDYHCYGTASISSSYKSLVLVEKRELSNRGFPDTKLQDLCFPFCSTLFLSSFGHREKCVSRFLLRILGNIAKLHNV